MKSANSRHLGGRSFLVTGANSGIGRATARALALRGATVWVACRSDEKAREIVSELRRAPGRAFALELDLADLRSVRTCAASFLQRGERLDVLVNNAGIAWRAGGLTRQGFELFFGVNYLGPFLLTKLLMPALLAAPAPRIVNVASMAHYEARGIDWEKLREPTVHRLGRPEYCVSKLCNVLHAKELARRHAATTLSAFALHPGVVASGVWRGMPVFERWAMLLRWLIRGRLVSNDDGAKTTLHCALEARAEESGLYFDDERPVMPSELAQDPVLARNLWERSEEWIAEYSGARSLSK
jgi:NAD(P)-dependent dehydrogenase (short-subunit alcohol dehydrogenase family)